MLNLPDVATAFAAFTEAEGDVKRRVFTSRSASVSFSWLTNDIALAKTADTGRIPTDPVVCSEGSGAKDCTAEPGAVSEK